MIRILNLFLHLLAATGWLLIICLVINPLTLSLYIKGILATWCVLMSFKNAFSGIRAWRNDVRKKQDDEWVDNV